MQTAEGKLRLFVAIDRTSKLALAKLVPSATGKSACAFLDELVAAAPYQIHTVLTDNVLCWEAAARLGQQVSVQRLAPLRDAI